MRLPFEGLRQLGEEVWGKEEEKEEGEEKGAYGTSHG
jgi:hypothetical protein